MGLEFGQQSRRLWVTLPESPRCAACTRVASFAPCDTLRDSDTEHAVSENAQLVTCSMQQRAQDRPGVQLDCL